VAEYVGKHVQLTPWGSTSVNTEQLLQDLRSNQPRDQVCDQLVCDTAWNIVMHSNFCNKK
jgi:hypothetical protein